MTYQDNLKKEYKSINDKDLDALLLDKKTLDKLAQEISMEYLIDCTGDACAGDEVKFTEIVWGGSFRSPVKLGERVICAKIIKDSYGKAKQQHTFTLEVTDSSGYGALEPGDIVRRKGRNVYRLGTLRKPWPNEDDRRKALNDKHQRGSQARRARDLRLQERA